MHIRPYVIKLCSLMDTWSSEVKQLRIAKTMGVLHCFLWNSVNYANMEGFCRDSYNYLKVLSHMLATYIIAAWVLPAF